ncbi:hypothetical protein HDU87_002345 [Geranomyces variabilis]|uniref:Retrovirus-related Pol polyprotein from transposon TNT 1-94-like beta-barrel domain-containing protein n=1 Tax=Geranomyces variabilis TaxID=109894 RepID=A0AAD5TBE1_9FUNG|nr:hypothetical protein HDU87_002345 [Geranomyces variabilis]
MKDALLLIDLRPIPTVLLTVANGEQLAATKSRTLTISNNETDEAIVCTDVLYVPGAGQNLVSSSPLNKDGYQIILGNKESSISKDGGVVLPLRHHGNLPFIDGYVETTAAAFALEAKAKQGTETSINYGINALGTSANNRFRLQI